MQLCKRQRAQIRRLPAHRHAAGILLRTYGQHAPRYDAYAPLHRSRHQGLRQGEIRESPQQDHRSSRCAQTQSFRRGNTEDRAAADHNGRHDNVRRRFTARRRRKAAHDRGCEKSDKQHRYRLHGQPAGESHGGADRRRQRQSRTVPRRLRGRRLEPGHTAPRFRRAVERRNAAACGGEVPVQRLRQLREQSQDGRGL